ncbi:MAG: polysaccharide deacetylase family protein [Solirubrobacterales bacterium]
MADLVPLEASGAFALTYDDGPDPAWTGRLLAELREREARATFFVMAPRAVQVPGLIEAMLAAGHEIGFHCHDHVRHSERTAADLERDLEIGLQLLDSVGVRPRSWRAPWGVETETTRRLAGEHGLRLWGWNLDSHDWRGDSAAEMLAALEAQGGLRGGDVVLMHDGLGPGARRLGCKETLALTGRLLDAATAAGLRPVPVSACAGVLA